MVKLKLIESQAYYKKRRRQLILSFLVCLLLGLIAGISQFNILLISLFIVATALVILLNLKANQQFKAALGQKHIELDAEEIRICSQKGADQEIINLKDVDQIKVKDGYGIPQESLSEIGQEIMGKPKENYIVLHQGSEKRRLDFEIDSYYGLHSFHRMISNWEKQYSVSHV